MVSVTLLPELDLLLDQAIVAIEARLTQQLELIVSHERYQTLHALWTGLWGLIAATDQSRNVVLDLLNVSKTALIEDFETYLDLTSSALFHHLYKNEYDQAGGFPYTSLLVQMNFYHGLADVSLLRQISKVAASCHCPVIVNADPKLFAVRDFKHLEEMRDLKLLFDSPDYIRWRSFCQDEDTRYLGMVLPRILAENPTPRRPPRFCHSPILRSAGFCWTFASYAFGILLVKSFVKQGWCVYIRGPKTGGLVGSFPGVPLGMPGLDHLEPPLEITFSDRQEQVLVAQGLIPLCFYKERERICVFSAPTLQNVRHDAQESGPADRLAASLPYLYLISRIAHYQKAIQRENIGLAHEAPELEKELDRWLRGLITTMRDPSREMRAERPLSGGQVKVEDNPATPGFFKVKLVVQPHLQLEGVTAKLELSTKMPRKKE